jgi:nucleoside-diphosphate-sugar epimerase
VRILVAGGAGFIGSHLSRRLLDRGDEVVVLDNFSTGRASNIEDLRQHPCFTVRNLDIVDGLPPVGHFDRVYHLASPASPPGYQAKPIETLRVNSEGTRHLLDLAGSTGAAFLFASTSEVYGDPLEHPQRETYRGNVSTTGPRSMYDEGKRFGEALVAAYTRAGGVNARTVRIFNTYGPASDPDDGRLIPNFISQALRGQPLTIYGSGAQTRSLCYVSDMVSGLIAAMESEAARGQVTNLGNPEEHSIIEFATLINELASNEAGLQCKDDPVGDDPARRRPDISLAKERLGWRPEVTLRDGLERTIASFCQEMGLERRAAGSRLSTCPRPDADRVGDAARGEVYND